MSEKKTETKATATKRSSDGVVDPNAEKQRDELNQAVKEKSAEVAMTQDEIRRTRRGGPLANRREELASMQPDFAALDRGK